MPGGGYGGGEPELAVAMAGSAARAAGDLDQGLYRVALGKACTQAREHC